MSNPALPAVPCHATVRGCHTLQAPGTMDSGLQPPQLCGNGPLSSSTKEDPSPFPLNSLFPSELLWDGTTQQEHPWVPYLLHALANEKLLLQDLPFCFQNDASDFRVPEGVSEYLEANVSVLLQNA